MNAQQYKSYILKKYSIPAAKFQAFILVDAISAFVDVIDNKNLILKGAFNLFLKNDYRRTVITRDLDFSVINNSIDNAVTFFKELPKTITETYKIELIGEQKLNISTSGYEGIRLKYKMYVMNTNMNTNFHVDIAIEELTNIKIYDKYKNLLSYTIERTLADKYVTMVQRGEDNTRAKDFEDLKYLYDNVDKPELYKLITELLTVRNVSESYIDWFKANFHDIPYILDYELIDIIKEIIQNT